MDCGYREVDSLEIVHVECCDLPHNPATRLVRSLPRVTSVAQVTESQEGHNFQIQMVAGLRRRWLRTPLKSLMTLVCGDILVGCGGPQPPVLAAVERAA